MSAGTTAGTPEQADRVVTARWDLDKTYLRTEFETMRDLARTALQAPEQKRAVPGAPSLLKELAKGGTRIHVLSGSPRQMRARLVAKLRIDGVSWDELTLKPNLSNLLRLRFRALRDQLGYKLPELLDAHNRDCRRLRQGARLHEVLVGDDAEADAFIYSLYADLCAGAVSRSGLAKILKAGKVYSDQRERCFSAFDRLEPTGEVRCILIHLDRQSPPGRFGAYGPRVVPFYNYAQAGFALLAQGILEAEGFVRLARSMMDLEHFEGEELARSIFELARRHQASALAIEHFQRTLRDGAPNHAGLRRLGDQLKDPGLLAAAGSPPEAPDVDYVALAKLHRGGRHRWSRYG